jgi:hypothetical protein
VGGESTIKDAYNIMVLKTEPEREPESGSCITDRTGGRTDDVINNLINKFIIIEINKIKK